MLSYDSPGAAAAAIIAGCVAAYLALSKPRSTRKLPPGPRGVPIFGNALAIPAEHPWLQFSEWAKEHGDVVALNALGQPIILLSSTQTVEDLLIKRGAVYSDRPPLYMASELVGWGRLLGVLRYGERFRQTRKYMSRILSARASQSYIPTEEHATAVFLRRLVKSPEKFEAHVRWVAAALILKLTYGYDSAEDDDPLVYIAEKGMTNFSLSTAPGWMVDLVPAIRFLPRWLPGMGFLQKAQTWRAETTAMIEEPYKFVKGQQVSGVASPSLSLSLLQGEEGNGVSAQEEDIIKWVAGALYAGGADTSVSSNLSFFLAMTLYPDVQRKAQAEIDALTRGERLPVYTDRERLPYVEALVKEVHRWNPVAPLGVPHYTSQDDEYRGWHVPAGSIVIPNIWHMLHDPAKYSKPMEFDPVRFLNVAEGSGVNEDPKVHAFGYGRRECPGKYIADSSVWLLVAMTLAAFNISKSTDADGNTITPDGNYESGTISHPVPFKCDIRLRYDRLERLFPAGQSLASA
ncbi:cytochrome P450 [Auricularia subglabra TFB-10046 SS5]|nr:cytochrome P450 [Auricularia subglabra TFB-10046 SS5]